MHTCMTVIYMFFTGYLIMNFASGLFNLITYFGFYHFWILNVLSFFSQNISKSSTHDVLIFKRLTEGIIIVATKTMMGFIFCIMRHDYIQITFKICGHIVSELSGIKGINNIKYLD